MKTINLTEKQCQELKFLLEMHEDFLYRMAKTIPSPLILERAAREIALIRVKIEDAMKVQEAGNGN